MYEEATITILAARIEELEKKFKDMEKKHENELRSLHEWVIQIIQ